MIAQYQVNWGIGPRQDVGAGTRRSAADRRCQRLEQFPAPRPPAWAGATMAVAVTGTGLAMAAWSFAALGELTQQRGGIGSAVRPESPVPWPGPDAVGAHPAQVKECADRAAGHLPLHLGLHRHCNARVGAAVTRRNGDDPTTTRRATLRVTATDPHDVAAIAPGVSGTYIYGNDSAGKPTLTDGGHYCFSDGKLPDRWRGIGRENDDVYYTSPPGPVRRCPGDACSPADDIWGSLGVSNGRANSAAAS
jgi:hypothetical protein